MAAVRAKIEEQMFNYRVLNARYKIFNDDDSAYANNDLESDSIETHILKISSIQMSPPQKKNTFNFQCANSSLNHLNCMILAFLNLLSKYFYLI